MSGNQEAQEDELLALTSIYDEEEFHRAESAQGGEIQLCLELPADFRVVVKGRPGSVRAAVHIRFKKTNELVPFCVAGQTQTEYNVCFLPPLVLNFELPEDYPSTSPPIFTLSSKWMTAAQVGLLIWHIDMSG